MSERPIVKKSSPSPIARTVESGADVRPLSPMRRLALPLGVAAALALAGGSGIAYAVAQSGEKHAAANHDDRRRPDDARRTPRTPTDTRADGSFVDAVVDGITDLLAPDTKHVDVLVPPTPPTTTPTTTPTYIDPDPPPRLAGMVAPPKPTVAVPPPKPTPIPPITNPPPMPGGMRPPAP